VHVSVSARSRRRWAFGSAVTGGGCVQDFANGASVWSSATGAHALTNDEVLTQWLEWGAVEGDLGHPTRDTFCGLAGGGCGQHFTGGSVYGSPATGAVAVYDVVRDVWSALGQLGPRGAGVRRRPHRHPGRPGRPWVGERPVRLSARAGLLGCRWHCAALRGRHHHRPLTAETSAAAGR
jgi:hypothetical protein